MIRFYRCNLCHKKFSIAVGHEGYRSVCPFCHCTSVSFTGRVG